MDLPTVVTIIVGLITFNLGFVLGVALSRPRFLR